MSPYLADHRVRRSTILPATAYLELALAAGREVFGTSTCELKEATLANPCLLGPDQPLWLQCTFDAESQTFRAFTRPIHDDRQWTEHLSAVVVPRLAEPDSETPPLDLDALAPAALASSTAIAPISTCT